MSWFSKKKVCDWCGATFKGEGVQDDNMLLCSQACLELKNAPPLKVKTVQRPATPETVAADLETARSLYADYQQLTAILLSGGHVTSTDMKARETMALDAQRAEMEAWQSLVDASRVLQQLGADTSRFDLMVSGGYTQAAPSVQVKQNVPMSLLSGAPVQDVKATPADSYQRFGQAFDLLRELLIEVAARG